MVLPLLPDEVGEMRQLCRSTQSEPVNQNPQLFLRLTRQKAILCGAILMPLELAARKYHSGFFDATCSYGDYTHEGLIFAIIF